MADVKRGKLVVMPTGEGGRLRVCFPTKKGDMSQPTPFESEQLHPDLAKKKLEDLNNLEVDLEFFQGKPRRICPVGKAWEETTISIDTRNQVEGDFHNPYNFVPTLPRDKANSGNSDLGDRNPLEHGMGHGVYHPNRWSGRIAVKLTTKTPLLIPDIFDKEDEGHKTYPLRIGADGKPYLPPTSIKGMLRSAYEAVTNSRLSVFVKHSDCLFYRMAATDGLSVVPARVEGDRVRLMMGATRDIPSPNKDRWRLPDNLMYAAWLPRYRQDDTSNLGFEGMTHGKRVRVWLEMWQKTNQGRPIFRYWLVREIVPFEQGLSRQSPQIGQAYRNHQPVPGGQMIKTDGYVCITNKNIKNKHDERVFFTYDSSISHSEAVSKHEDNWRYLISNYQKIHKGKARDEELEWSRHVVDSTQELTLSNGTLCYAYVERASSRKLSIKALYPVTISRAIYNLDPESLLHESLQPATKMSELSPADRVFGWVNQDGKGSYKGNLRIHSVRCQTSDAIQPLGDDGLPLAILGQPKEQQARFYIAKDKLGTPLENGIPKQEGYGNTSYGLRGRKVYLHHNVPANYWEKPIEDRTQEKNGGYCQEYRRPKKVGEQDPNRPRLRGQGGALQEQRDDQNRSIRAWVKENAEFSFTIDVTNLSNVELGGLLWLLSLSEGHYHRLGGGKPLGFGSVRLEVRDITDLRKGNDWKEFYSSLESVDNSDLSQNQAKETILTFKNEVGKIYGSNDFESVSFIKAFCQAAKGFSDGKPIHYPRVTPNPDPEGKSFEWFVANERTGGRQMSLPSLTDDPGLPDNHSQ